MSSLSGLNLAYLEGMFEDYLRDPSSVPDEWRGYFERLEKLDGELRAKRFSPSFQPTSLFNPPGRPSGAAATTREAEMAAIQHKVDQLIRNFRVRGHIIADLDPLGIPRPEPAELCPAHYGFTEADMGRPISTLTVAGPKQMTLGSLLRKLRNTYCRSIGVQFMHIDDLAVREWLQERMEGTENRLDISREEQLRILTRLTDAVILEEFIRKKYTGAKSFSLSGSESLIPLLDLAIEKAGELGVDEVVMAMAHRGRLNVLINILGKSPQQVFREFDDADPDLHEGRGDVKYHQGYSSDWITASGKEIHLSLCFNPSHLEFVNPVALGRARAKQDRVGDLTRARGLTLLIHGDAAHAGEGVIQETLNMSELAGYTTGGTLHVILNNQIGFTTPPEESRSTPYATAVAKMLQIPIFHVNGEDPEAVAQVVRLALDFRMAFKRDVVVEMYGYRRYGHNEGDEPSFTQPLLYRAIEKRKSVREGYLDHLLSLGGVTREEAHRIAEERNAHLENELTAARSEDYVHKVQSLTGIWRGYYGGLERAAPDADTGVPIQRLSELLEAQTHLPSGFHPHPKLVRWLEARREMARGERPLDWAAAESLAFASLAAEGFRVRLSGQDCQRGTFSQRHSVLHDYETGESYFPLQHLRPDQAPVEILNSPLSEVGVLGFEYGFSLDWPDGLVLWEAQFGDFCNVAQVIIDQFIASAEDKWHRLSGLVLLLPHGLEGQGPEHSSARLERFLTLASQNNFQIACPTTPAQYFHLLRRQVLRPWRKPLVVLTPKGLLRHPGVVSPLGDLSQGFFHRFLLDDLEETAGVERILLCSGKIYYELAEERGRLGLRNVAIIRLEQLYPFWEEVLDSMLSKYPPGAPICWVQEEPENMGAWRYLRARFGAVLFDKNPFTGISRPISASPATGSANSHKREQRKLIEAAFKGLVK